MELGGVACPKKKVVYHGDRLKYEIQWVQCTPSISFIHVKNQARMYQEYGEHPLLILHAFLKKSMQLGGRVYINVKSSIAQNVWN